MAYFDSQKEADLDLISSMIFKKTTNSKDNAELNSLISKFENALDNIKKQHHQERTKKDLEIKNQNRILATLLQGYDKKHKVIQGINLKTQEIFDHYSKKALNADKLLKENQRLKEELKKADNTYLNLKKETNDKLSGIHYETKKYANSLKNKVSLYNSELEKKNLEVSHLKEEIKNHENMIETLKSENNKRSIKNNELIEQNNNLKENLKLVKNDLDTKFEHNKVLKKSVEALQKKLNELINDSYKIKENHKKEIERLKQDHDNNIENHKISFNNLKQDTTKQLHNMYNISKKEIYKLKDYIKRLHVDIDKKDMEIKKSNSKIEELKNDAGSLIKHRNEIKKINSDYEIQVLNLKESIKDKDKKIRLLEDKKTQLSEKVLSLDHRFKKNTEKTVKIEKYYHELILKMKNDHKHELNDHKQIVFELKEDNRNLKNGLYKLEKDKEYIQKDNLKLKSDLDSEMIVNKDIHDELKRYKLYNNSLNDKINKLSAIQNRLIKENNSLKQESEKKIEFLKEKNKKHIQDILEKNAKDEMDYKTQVYTLSKEMENLIEKLNKEKKAHADFRKKISSNINSVLSPILFEVSTDDDKKITSNIPENIEEDYSLLDLEEDNINIVN